MNDLHDGTPGNGFGGIGVDAYQIFGDSIPRRFSTITVLSTDPDWSFGIGAISYVDPTPRNAPPPSPNYCSVNPIARPTPQNLSGFGWTMRSEVSDMDGLVLNDVRLNGRLMAERISVPYYKIETSTTPPIRGELRPNDTEGTLRSRLVTYYQ